MFLSAKLIREAKMKLTRVVSPESVPTHLTLVGNFVVHD